MLDMKNNKSIDRNIEYIKEMFPNTVTEENGEYKIDFNRLKQELSDNIIEVEKERYQLTWPGKNEAMLNANLQTRNTLRPLEEKSVDFDNTKNIYIEGDNLEALKILQESYLNKIKLVYIDPPYNKGKNLIYKNDYSIDINDELVNSGLINEDGIKLSANLESNGRFHSDWLSMMYPRIKLARNLLRDDGVIVLSIDDSELSK